MQDKFNSYHLGERGERPWGNWAVTDVGPGFAVKRITVGAGEKLSLQRHRYRHEHWIIVCGSAIATLDGAEKTVNENETVFVPIGSVHRLFNPGPDDLIVIEVQYGPRLDETDIERLQDNYGRV
jgi:mannose-6-phosphate isomerase-like protein (cupin superfamily)